MAKMKYGNSKGGGDCPKTSNLTGGEKGAKGDYQTAKKHGECKVTKPTPNAWSGGGGPAGRGG